MQGTASNNAPSPSVVVPHFVVGSTAWLIALILLLINPDCLLEHYFNFKLLAITHLLVLSWITTIIFGALYQLLPVVLLCKLHSEKLALITFITLQIGSLGMGNCFWNGILGFPLIASGSIVCIAIVLFVVNFSRTLYKSNVSRIEKHFISTSIGWLLITVLVGVLLAINFSFPFLSISHLEILKIHAHIGIIGWVLQLIIGVSSVLIPMFMLAHNLNKRSLQLSYILINCALLLGITSKLFGFEIGLISSIFIGISGLLSFLFYIYNAFKNRVKKKLDIGMKKSMTAFLFVLLSLGLSLPIFLNINNNHFEIAYFTALIIGFISTLIMGQTYKTLPFIIWLKEYKTIVGKVKTPLPKDLYSERLAVWQFRTNTLGFILLLIGILLNLQILIQIGIGIILIAAILYTKNILNIILHKSQKNG